ncbi:UTP--glucose-1-phosphate uridylyltransferase GalU [Aerococcaceae bacterium NML201209]|nr:UTP--glucose-1-phosphate uridylyltransferase GalU [Aerococcaceae bacterium NML201209]MCW6681946.1 UTP--glucose-1-phosphate uridylyltransferase GalU [Aerococcaceae bacterium NML160702]
MTTIRKAVIPAAGYGTGFLPATKALAKEMLPIVDKPIIQFIVEEALASGIEEILIVTGKTKRPIEDHFDSNIELENNLESKGKAELLELVKSTPQVKLYFIRQSYPKGLGDAILQAKAFVADEPFAVLLGDNIMESEVPVTKQLMDVFKQKRAANLAVIEIDPTDSKKYGMVEVSDPTSDSTLYNVKRFVEKPESQDAPSNLAIAGRYILTPQIFTILEQIAPGIEDEIQLTDAINELNRTQRVFAKKIDGTRHDVGNKLGYMKKSIEYGLIHPETKDEFKQYLINLSDRL